MDIQTFNKAFQLKNELDECIKDEERAIKCLNDVKIGRNCRLRIGETYFFISNEMVIEFAQKVVEFYHEKRVEAEHIFRIL